MLCAAARDGDVAGIRELLKSGAKVDLTSPTTGSTALHTACAGGHADAVRALLAAGAKVNRRGAKGRTALIFACSNGHIEVARLLLEDRTIDVNARDDTDTPLFQACYNSSIEMVDLLLSRGADTERVDCKGWRPLHAAVIDNAERVVPHHVVAGSDAVRPPTAVAAAERPASDSALHFALTRALLAAGAKVNVVNKNGNTPLHIACMNGFTDAARLMLAAGAKVEAVNKFGCSPLHDACLNGHIDAVNLMLAAGAKVDQRSANGHTLLNSACHNGHIDVARLLLETAHARAYVNTPDDNDASPLLYAGNRGDLPMMRLLLDNGALTNAPGQLPPLHAAVSRQNPKATALLLAAGAAINARFMGMTALQMCDDPGIEILRLMIGAGADITLRDREGRTPVCLMRAAVASGAVATHKLCSTCGARCHRRCPCGTERYCDADCQRTHRPAHKALCAALMRDA